MSLTHILIFAALSPIITVALPVRWRQWALFVGSVLAIYWLQPPLTIWTFSSPPPPWPW